jgi:acylpyruvate hydrolase
VKLAAIRTEKGKKAVLIDGNHAVDLGTDDLGAFLGRENWAVRAMNASGESFPLEGVNYAPLVADPSKIICVGLNYLPQLGQCQNTCVSEKA